jgi:hypothetical protein
LQGSRASASPFRMEHTLSINWVVGEDPQGSPLRSLFETVTAEIDLPPCPQLAPPASITGKLVGFTPRLYHDFKFRKGVEVTFDARCYRFSRLEEDGTFEVLKTW